MTSSNILILTNKEYKGKEYEFTFLLDSNRKPLTVYARSSENASIVGDIYIAKIKDVLPHLNCAFGQIGDGRKVYIPYKPTDRVIFTKKAVLSNDNLCQSDEILIMITKDAVKTKDPVATTNITISSKDLMLTSGDTKIGVSKKLQSECKDRLKRLAESNFELINEAGLIFRTSAGVSTDDSLANEIKSITARYKKLLQKAKCQSYPACISKGRPFAIDILRNYNPDAIEKIVCDSEDTLSEFISATEEYLGGLFSEKAQVYSDESYSLDKLYGLSNILDKASEKYVNLPSGANIVIEPTEALTVIDVNSARSDKKHSFLDINLEASHAIARELKVRNISGIIVIDYINVSDEDEADIIKALETDLNDDPVRTKVHGFTNLGLVEVTREKKYASLKEMLT